MSENFKGPSKCRGWLCVVYPESAPDDWIQILASIGAQALISPLHDQDLNADGEVKKPHYHVILLWDGPTTKSNAQAVVDLIRGVGCFAMATLRGAARYLCHLDNPEKHRYNPEDVKQLGGLVYDDIINSASDDLLTLYEIFDWIDENVCVSFRQFMIYARSFRPDWAKVILTRHRENVIAYQRSLQWELSASSDGFAIPQQKNI